MQNSKKTYDILVIGGGGREHAILSKLKESNKCGKLYCSPGNGGIAQIAECFDVATTDVSGMVELAKKLEVDIVFVAPDDPLVMGMVDILDAAGFITFGPTKAAALIEGSKVFSKKLMEDYNIPTAEYRVFESSKDALDFINQKNIYPAVIKADGLAFGKGVILARNFKEAKEAVTAIIDKKLFGDSGKRVVIEEFLTGPEVSVLAFSDGKTIKPMVSAMDHKRAFDGDMGPNTGGMGAISPNPIYRDDIANECIETIFKPTIKAMEKEGRAFKGCLFFGLMITENGPKVIEYNCRFGDPETQVVLPLLKTDLIDIILSVHSETLGEIDVQWLNKSCACVVMASGGYPADFKKGIKINGLDKKGGRSDSIIYHAGTKCLDDTFYTNGGRVLGVTAVNETLEGTLDKAYEAVSKIHFKDVHYRKDIGKTNNIIAE